MTRDLQPTQYPTLKTWREMGLHTSGNCRRLDLLIASLKGYRFGGMDEEYGEYWIAPGDFTAYLNSTWHNRNVLPFYTLIDAAAFSLIDEQDDVGFSLQLSASGCWTAQFPQGIVEEAPSRPIAICKAWVGRKEAALREQS